MAWNRTSNTCVSVYGALDDLKQYGTPTTFEDAGPLMMKYLAFFNTLATGGPVSAAALAIATALDEVLTDSYAGLYKTGIDSNKAIAELQLILKVANQTVEDLSNTADTLYTF